ncbi:TPA: hypothetical protein ACF3DL_002666, partial [Enterococcus faecium]
TFNKKSTYTKIKITVLEIFPVLLRSTIIMLLSRKKSIIDIIVGSCSNDKKQKIVNRVEYREITYNKKLE